MMNKRCIYFDCAATMPPFQEALSTFEKVSLDSFANSSSNHGLGFESHKLLEKARAQIAKYLNVLTDEVIFTSGASEGNNLAIQGVVRHNSSWGKKIITTACEHPSVMEVFKKLERDGMKVVYLHYDKDGNLDLDQLSKELDKTVSLVSIMAVNNEVGYLFPIEKIYKLIKEKSRALLHVDATQAIGKENLPSDSYDLMTFSGHKIGGLKGSGVLIKKKKVELDPLILGGSQENGLRAGTSALPLDCALATALRLVLASCSERRKQAATIKSYLKEELSSIPEIVITSPENSTPFILSFALKEHKGSVIAEALSNEGIYVSTKSACSSREEGYSYVLKNAGYDENISYNGIRLSFSGRETLEQAKEFMSVFSKILNEIKVRS